MEQERCPDCAALIDDDERYCHNCGTLLQDPLPSRRSVSRELLERYDAESREKDVDDRTVGPSITTVMELPERFVCPECGAYLEDDEHECAACGMQVTLQMRKPDPFLDPLSVREVLTAADDPEPDPVVEESQHRKMSGSTIAILLATVAVIAFGTFSRCSGTL